MGKKLGKTQSRLTKQKNKNSTVLTEIEINNMLGVSGLKTPDRMVLEQRLLLDAAGMETADTLADQVALEQAENWQEPVVEDEAAAAIRAISATDELQAPLKDSRNEIVFIDSAVADLESLLEGVAPSTEIVIIDANSDGVEQIANALQGRSDLDAIHIFAHGRPGTLDLGNAKLTEASLNNKHADELAIIQASLSQNADFLIYGCDFGAHARGASAIQALSNATGADVAASTDLTGAANFGGDWDLEVETGIIETRSLSAENWNGTLETPPEPTNAASDSINFADGEFRIFVSGNNTDGLGFQENGFEEVVNTLGGTLTVLNNGNEFDVSGATGDGSATSSTITFDNATATFSTSFTTTNASEFRTTTASNFFSGDTGEGIFIDPEQGGTAGDFYDVDIAFEEPVNAFSFDLVDIFDTITTGNPVAEYQVIADGEILVTLRSPFFGDDGTANIDVLDGDGNLQATVVAGQNIENTIGFVTAGEVNNLTIRHTIVNGAVLNTARDPHGLDSIAFSTDISSNQAPTLDLDVISSSATPGEDGFTLLDFSGLNGESNPQTLNNGQTEDVDGAGNGQTAIYRNVGVLADGTAIDIVATVVNQTGIDPVLGISGGDNANVRLGGGNNNTATVRWDVFIADTLQVVSGEFVTGTPVTGNFTALVNDLDNRNNDNTFEEIEIAASSVDAYNLEDPANSNIVVTENNGVLNIRPTDNDPGTPGVLPSNTVQLTFTNTSSFTVFYNRQSEGANFGLDGNFGAGFFANPLTVDTNAEFATIFTEGNTPVNIAAQSANANDIAEDDIQLLEITPGNISNGADEIITFNGDGATSITLPLDGSDTSQQSLTIGGTNIFIQFNTATNTIEITEQSGGVLPQDDLNAIIRTATYENTSNTPSEGSGTDRTLMLRVTDSSGLSSNNAVSTITVIGVEDVVTIDTDGDGVNDDIDVDDDNDGILDVNEGLRVVDGFTIGEAILTENGDGSGSFDIPVIDSLGQEIGSLTLNYTGFTGDGSTNGSNGTNPNTFFTPILNVGLVDNNIALQLIYSLPNVNNHNFTYTVTSNGLDFTGAEHNVQGQALQGGGPPGRVESGRYTLVHTLSDDPVALTAGGTTHTVGGVGVALGADLADGTEILRNSGRNANRQFNVGFDLLNGETYGIDARLNSSRAEGIENTTFVLSTSVSAQADSDFDSDGIANQLDIDSDNDGITDNIEAQTANGFIAPSGRAGTADYIDLNQDGLDDNYDDRIVAEATAAASAGAGNGAGLSPVDSDGDGDSDYLDTDSDNEGGNDTAEAGLGSGSAIGLSDATTDADGDGLFDVFDAQNGTAADDGFDVNESIATGATALPDIDGDASGGVPLSEDVDFRDAETIDTDSDGVNDFIDVDDDNDGILDIFERIPSQGTSENFENPPNVPTESGFDSFATAFPSAADSPLTNFAGTAGFFTNNDLSVAFPSGPVNLLPAFEGNFYSGLHSSENFNQEVIQLELDVPVSAGQDVGISFAAYQLELGSLNGNPVFNQPGTFQIFGIRENSSIVSGSQSANNATNVNSTTPTTIGSHPDVDLLGQSDLIDNTTEWREFVINFTATENYDRILIVPVGNGIQLPNQSQDNTAFLAIDAINFGILTDVDTDSDGIADHLDIDSDNDGITDNIEAQTTNGFVPPSGVGGAPSFADVNMDGLDDAFDNRNADNSNTLDMNSVAATQAEALINPVDTDNDGDADFIDTDSDNDGSNDTIEAGLGIAPVTGLSEDMNDADSDGLFDQFDTQNGTTADDGFNINESIATGAAALPDIDGDASGGLPLSEDVDFRDAQDDFAPPVLDLNSAASLNDTDRDFSAEFIAGGNSVAIVDIDGDALEGEQITGFSELRITPTSALPDGANEVLQVAGLDIPLNADITHSGVILTGVSTVFDITYRDGVISVREVSGGLIPSADFDALLRSTSYLNLAAVPSDSTARTFDFQAIQFDPSRVVIDFEELTPGSQATAEQIGSDPYWASAGAQNGQIQDANNAGPFNQTLANNADGTYLFHNTGGNVPNDQRIIFGQDNIPVEINQDYTVSIDIGRQNSFSAGPFEVLINGASIGIIDVNSGPIQDWQTLTFNFNSGDASEVNFQLRNTSTNGTGNDFGIDNIIFERNPLILSNIATASVDVIATVPPNAQDDAFTIDENPEAGTSEIGVITSGDLFADNGSGVDSDANNDPLNITQINGEDITNGEVITLDSGALLTIRTDGSFDYDPNGAFDNLDTGEIATDSFVYTVSDGTADDTAMVTITINGDNDAPTIDLNGALPGTDFNSVFVEDQPGQPLANLLSFDAVIEDDEDNIAQVTIIPLLPDPNDGNDEFLRINSNGIDLTIRLSDGLVTANTPLVFGDTTFEVSYNNGEIEFTNADGGTFESGELEGFLRLLAYQNTDQNNTDGARAFEFQVIDPAGVTVATSTITVDRVNDAPVPTIASNNNGTVVATDNTAGLEPSVVISPDNASDIANLTGDVVRDAIANGANASDLGLISVADLLAQLDISDAEQAEFAIGVIFADESQGRFQYVRTGAGFDDHEFTDFQLGDPDNTDPTPVPDGEALLLASDTYIRFIANPGFLGSAALTFRISDLSVGTPSNPPSTVPDDSGGVAPTNTSSLSSSVFMIDIAADTDGDGIINSEDIDSDNDGILDVVEAGLVPTPGIIGQADAFNDGSGFYQIINNGTIDGETIQPGQLFSFNPLTDSYVPIGDPAGFDINATGYDPDSDFIYGLAQTDGVDAAGNVVLADDLIKIDRDGEVFRIGRPSTNINGQIAGTIFDGMLAVRSGGSQISLLDISGAVGSTDDPVTLRFNLTEPVSGEFLIIDSILYQIPNNTTGTFLQSVDLTGVMDGDTLTVNQAQILGDFPAASSLGLFGAGWTSTDPVTGQQELFFSRNNTGEIFRINDFDTANPTAELFLQGVATGSNDGAGPPDQAPPSLQNLPDTDGDGIPDFLDIDSDDDGITDTIEAQTTAGFIAPSGTGNPDMGGAFVDVNRDGLDDNFDAGLIAGGPANGIGLTPVDTDGLGLADFIDPDSDDDGILDADENGLGVTFVAGDTDGDGLADVFETAIDGDANDGFIVNEGITDPLNTSNGFLPDAGGDASIGTATPLVNDLDFRDPNDDPVAQNDAAITDEDTALNANLFTDNGNGADSDPDGNAITVTQVNGASANVGMQITLASGALLTVNSDGSYSYDPNGQFESLRVGETGMDSFTYQISDGNGGFDTATVNITIDGVADAPVVDLNGADEAGIDYAVDYIENDPAINIVDTDFSITDPENNITEIVITLTNGEIGDTLQFPSMLPGGITATQVPGTALFAPGPQTITLNAGSGTTTQDWNDAIALIQFVPQTNDVHNPVPGDRVITIRASDEVNLSSDLASSTITVVPVNDPPTLDLDDDNSGGVNAGNFTGTFTEDAGSVSINSGIVITDLDDSELATATVSLTNPQNNDQIFVDGVLVFDNGMITSPIGTSNGVDYTVVLNSGIPEIRFDDVATTAEYTAALESITFNNTSDTPDETDRIFNVILNDSEDDSPLRTATISVVPANDPPVVIDPNDPSNPPADPNAVVPLQTGEDGTDITLLDVTQFFADPDDTVLTFALGADAPSWLMIDPMTGEVTGTPPADASINGPAMDGIFPVTIIASDPDGLTASTMVTFDISNPAPDAMDDALSNDEGAAPITGNVITDDNGMGMDVDGNMDNDPLTVSEVDGDTANVGQPVNAPTGGQFIINSDGSYTFDDNGDFEDLAVGEMRDTTITYQVSDGQGGFDTATVTVTVMGANDAPEVVDPNNPGTPPADPSAVVPAQSALDGEPITDLNLTPFFADPDASDVLTFSTPVGALPDGLMIDPNTGVLSGTPSSDASQGGDDPANAPGVYTIPVTVDDGNGGTVTTNVIYTISNQPPVAEDDFITTDEDTVATAVSVFDANGISPLLIGDMDGGNDNDVLTISGVGINTGSLDPANVGMDVEGANGGTFNIDVNGNVNFDPGTDFQNLTDGESATTSITYLVSDNQEGFDTATVTVIVNGANDAPVIIDPNDPFPNPNQPPVPADPNNVIPDQSGNDSTQISMPLDVTPFFADVDDNVNTDLTFNASNLPDGLMIDPGTGIISGTPDADASQLGDDPVNNPGVYTVIITATDPDGEMVTTQVTYNISNPPPVAEDDALVANEDMILTGENVLDPNGNDPLLIGDTDSDMDPITVSAIGTDALSVDPANVGMDVMGTNGGTFNIDAMGNITFNPGTDFQGLDVGETRDTTITYQISDGEGGFDTATVTITVNGANDAPVVIDPNDPFPNPNEPPVPTNSNTVIADVMASDGGILSPLDVMPFFVDVDGEPLEFSATNLPAGLMINPMTGIISGTIDNSASQGGDDPLNAPGVFTAVITATDPEGEMVSTQITYTIENLPPTAQDDTVSIDEDTVLIGDVFANNGNGIDSDTPPDSDNIFVSAIDGLGVNVGQSVAAPTGGSFTINQNGTYSFDPGTDFQDLDVGETRDTSVTYQISDGEGGFDTAVLSVTVTGSNDGPRVIDPNDPFPNLNEPPVPVDPNNVINDVMADDGSQPAPLDVTPFFVDVDGESLEFSVDNLPVGLVIDPLTGIISGTVDNSASQGGDDPLNAPGVYTVTVTATDPEGEAVSTEITYTIENVAPIAQDDLVTIGEDTILIGNVISDNGSGADLDGTPDSDDLIISAVNGDENSIGQPVEVPTGGSFTINQDGSYLFDPETDFQDLDVGETRDTMIEYQISDGEGGFDTATITVTVTGSNDGPIIIDPLLPPSGDPNAPTNSVDPNAVIPAQTLDDSQTPAPLDVSEFFFDVDDENPAELVYAVDNLPEGLMIDPDTGIITGTVDNSASQGGDDPVNNPGIYTVTVTATDPEGELVSTQITYTVTNPAPVAVDDITLTNEDTVLEGNVILGENSTLSDRDTDGDTINVSAVGGDAASVGQPITGTQGGVFIINPDGTYTFDPGDEFNGLGVGETRDTTIEYQISDGEGGLDTAILTVTVTGENDGPIPVDPTQTPIDPANPPIGVPFDPQVPFTPPLDTENFIPTQMAQDSTSITPIDLTPFFGDPDANDTVAISVDSNDLPPGLVFNPDTGIISGTPASNASQGGSTTNPGTYIIPVTATDENGDTFTTNVIFEIINISPDITVEIEDFTETVGNDFAIQTAGNFEDIDSDDLVFSAQGLPEGLEIDPVTGEISGQLAPNAVVDAPNGDGIYTVTVSTDDGEGGIISTSFTFTALDAFVPVAELDALPLPPTQISELETPEPEEAIILGALDALSAEREELRRIEQIFFNVDENGLPLEVNRGGHETIATVAGETTIRTLIYQGRIYLEVRSQEAMTGWTTTDTNWQTYEDSNLFVLIPNALNESVGVTLENKKLGITLQLEINNQSGTFNVSSDLIGEPESQASLNGFSTQLRSLKDGLVTQTRTLLKSIS